MQICRLRGGERRSEESLAEGGRACGWAQERRKGLEVDRGGVIGVTARGRSRWDRITVFLAADGLPGLGLVLERYSPDEARYLADTLVHAMNALCVIPQLSSQILLKVMSTSRRSILFYKCNCGCLQNGRTIQLQDDSVYLAQRQRPCPQVSCEVERVFVNLNRDDDSLTHLRETTSLGGW